MIQREKFRRRFRVPFRASSANCGFTLLEMIVVTAVFALVLTATSELFITIYSVAKKTNNIRKIQQDARYALETISREARLAKSVTINTKSEATNPNQIKTKSKDDVEITFSCNACGTVDGTIKMTKGTDPAQNLTSSATAIKRFEINDTQVAKEGDSNNIQPFFKLTIEAEAKESSDRTGTKPKITLGTLISRRNYYGTQTSQVKKIAAGYYFSMALDSSGKVWAWGNNNYGQLGIGSADNNDHSSPLKVKDSTGTGELTGIVDIATGAYHALALDSSGKVWALGNNGYGQLGDNSTTNRWYPVKVKDSAGTGELSGIVAIAAGGWHSLALDSSGKVWAWGNNGYGELGDNKTSNPISKLPVRVRDSTGNAGTELSGIVGIGGGDSHSFALDSSGKVWDWGWNDRGQLGDNSTTNRWYPVKVKDSAGTDELSGIIGIGGGGYGHSLALDSSSKVWAWGRNEYGQLGIGSADNNAHSLPLKVKDSAGTGELSGIITIVSSRMWHSLALDSSGKVWAWGYNYEGQLGIGTAGAGSPYKMIPVRVKDSAGTGELSKIIEIAGGYHTLALDSDGKLWAWGYNGKGQLGIGSADENYHPLPAQVIGL